MSNFPNSMPPDSSHNQAPKNRKTLWILVATAVVFILLLFLLPELLILVTLLGLLVAVIGMIRGKVPWLPVRGRKNSGLFGLGMVVLMFVSGAIMGPAESEANIAASEASEPIVTSSESATPTPTESASPTAIADFVGQTCEGDELVMEQGDEKLYCDEDTKAGLIWATQDEHDKSVLAAKEAAEQKAAEEKAEAEKKEAEAKAAAEKKEAEAKAVAEKEAAEKKAAEMKVAEEKAAKEKAARLAEVETTKEAYVAPKKQKAPTSTYYANCSAVRAAGADPIYRGDPGYSSKLDRDGDGVACE